MRRISWSKRLGDAILGTEPSIRPRVRLTLLSAAVFLSWLSMLFVMQYLGLVSPVGVRFIAIYDIVGLSLFYALIRSGFSGRFRDRALVEQQMLMAAGVTALGYLFFPMLRAALMPAMCMSQAFGLFSLRANQTIRSGLCSVLALMSLLLIVPHVDLQALDTEFEIGFEAQRIFMSSLIVMMLAFLSRHYALLRQKVRDDKKRLVIAVEQVNRLVNHDPLTGLVNRQRMQELLEQELERLRRSGGAFSIALIDLDHFKRINDVHGHQMGDAVLVAFAQAAQGALRTGDIAARWGGEEFLILMPATTAQPAGLAAAQRLLEAIRELVPSVACPELRISFSAGIADCTATSIWHDSVDQLLERADRALYVAKSAGRNQCVLAPPLRLEAPEDYPYALHGAADQVSGR